MFCENWRKFWYKKDYLLFIFNKWHIAWDYWLLPKPALIGIIFLVIATLGMDMLDIIGNLPFMRMVNPKQRTEMTTVYSTWKEFSFAITPGFASLFLFL